MHRKYSYGFRLLHGFLFSSSSINSWEIDERRWESLSLTSSLSVFELNKRDKGVEDLNLYNPLQTLLKPVGSWNE